MKTKEQFNKLTENAQEKYLDKLGDRYISMLAKANYILNIIWFLDGLYGAKVLKSAQEDELT